MAIRSLYTLQKFVLFTGFILLKHLKLLGENLLLSAVSISTCAIAGFLLSFPINVYFHPEATAFKQGAITAIETQKLNDYRRTQGILALSSAAVGAVAAQVVFLLIQLKKNSSDR